MECFLCDREWTLQLMDAEDREVMVCEHCAKDLLNGSSNHIDRGPRFIMYKWVIYASTNPNVITCRWCWAPVHKEQAAMQDWRCIWCTANSLYLKRKWVEAEWHYCTECGAIHRHWMCPTGLGDDINTNTYLSFQVGNENKAWNPKWDSLNKSSYVKKIWQFQTERELRASDIDLLEKFYHHWKKFSHYYTREPINIEWEVSYYNYQIMFHLL